MFGRFLIQSHLRLFFASFRKRRAAQSLILVVSFGFCIHNVRFRWSQPGFFCRFYYIYCFFVLKQRVLGIFFSNLLIAKSLSSNISFINAFRVLCFAVSSVICSGRLRQSFALKQRIPKRVVERELMGRCLRI